MLVQEKHAAFSRRRLPVQVRRTLPAFGARSFKSRISAFHVEDAGASPARAGRDGRGRRDEGGERREEGRGKRDEERPTREEETETEEEEGEEN